jgi:hypothetical protein
MKPFILDNGIRMELGKVAVFRYGKMEVSMTGFGSGIKQTALAD